MTNPTSNFGWPMPTATDLVTDLPADFEVFGQAVDTDLADLNGGTTGQVLSKTSGTDLAFTWVDTDDTNAIQNAIVTAKGDLIGASASATPLVLAVGADGTQLVADSAEATGLKWATPAAGGAFTLIATATPSAASTFSFTSIPATYKHLFVLVPELVWAATGNYMKMRFATGNYYSTRVIGTAAGSTAVFSTERGETYFGQGSNNCCPILKGYTSSGVFGDISSASAIWIYDYTNTSTDRIVTWRAGGASTQFDGMGIYDHNVAIDNIDFQTTASTVTGTAYLYGVS